MPIFTGSFADTERAKQVGSAAALREYGAILPVSIGVHSAFSQSAVFVPGLALIDTGASHTAICVDTARDTLHLTPQSTGQRIVTGAGGFKVDVYACRMRVPALAYESDIDEVLDDTVCGDYPVYSPHILH